MKSRLVRDFREILRLQHLATQAEVNVAFEENDDTTSRAKALNMELEGKIADFETRLEVHGPPWPKG